MPKGVEHISPIFGIARAALRDTSVMPKGVEHRYPTPTATLATKR